MAKEPAVGTSQDVSGNSWMFSLGKSVPSVHVVCCIVSTGHLLASAEALFILFAESNDL